MSTQRTIIEFFFNFLVINALFPYGMYNNHNINEALQVVIAHVE